MSGKNSVSVAGHIGELRVVVQSRGFVSFEGAAHLERALQIKGAVEIQTTASPVQISSFSPFRVAGDAIAGASAKGNILRQGNLQSESRASVDSIFGLSASFNLNGDHFVTIAGIVSGFEFDLVANETVSVDATVNIEASRLLSGYGSASVGSLALIQINDLTPAGPERTTHIEAQSRTTELIGVSRTTRIAA